MRTDKGKHGAQKLAAGIFTAVMVRDNLTLNVIQLLHPSPAISAWQAQGGVLGTAVPARSAP